MIKVEKINDGDVTITDEGEELVYPRSMFPADIKEQDNLEYLKVPVAEFVHVEKDG